jgi:drug/metabolite transporter (DMT)-like permease
MTSRRRKPPLPAAPGPHRERRGALFCLASAAGFGAMGIFAKLGYDAGLDVVTLLATRFALAAALLWAFIALRGTPVRDARRTVGLGLLLGLIGYASQAGLYYSALERIDAGLTSLLLYFYPAVVTVAGVALGRERATTRRWIALAVASLGVVLVLGGGHGGADGLGIALAMGAGVAYAAYILASDVVGAGSDPIAFTASVCTGAALTFLVAGGAGAGLDYGFEPIGWLWLVALVLVSTIGAIAFFFAGLGRVGPSRASILSTLEPATTVVLAFLVFGETLGWSQILGGVLVLSGAVLVVEKLDAQLGGEGSGEPHHVGPGHAHPAQRLDPPHAVEAAVHERRPLQARA